MYGVATTSTERAQAFIVYLDGIEAAALTWCEDNTAALDLVRRGRVIAGDLLVALDQLEQERSARKAIQEARDRLLGELAW